MKNSKKPRNEHRPDNTAAGAGAAAPSVPSADVATKPTASKGVAKSAKIGAPNSSPSFKPVSRVGAGQSPAFKAYPSTLRVKPTRFDAMPSGNTKTDVAYSTRSKFAGYMDFDANPDVMGDMM